jgi:hypothetical protein
LVAADSDFTCREINPTCPTEEPVSGMSSSFSWGAIIGELTSETLAIACVPKDGVVVKFAGVLGVSTKSMNLFVEQRSYRELAISETVAISGIVVSAFFLGAVGLGVAVATLHNRDAIKSSSLADTAWRLKSSGTPSILRGMLTFGTGMT